ncbi:hypothetical protein O7626_26250 [Micromonospora sp. WMMD1102]|uniref:hypothetical protein n=1 Tax=Micromonospora sp. WMMD1102 TaxID=3016105 RepID=UPI002415050B|nr:hypothetical protein [Micromonospora sp. WMMD1102]MDG4789384.1 hypothetical protein [Micromonospora sp. WMMD1102]
MNSQSTNQHSPDPSATAHDLPSTDRRPRSARGLLVWLRNRWPTAVAVAMSLPGFLAETPSAEAPDLTKSLGGVFVLLPLGYLVLAKLRRRRATWPVVFTGIGLVVLTRIVGNVDPAFVLTAIALLVLIWSVADGQLRRDRTLQTQALAFGGFAAVSFAALAILTQEPTIAGYLVAAAWLAHGIWDLIHLKLDRVVAPTFAEWCAVIDILIAVQLVLIITA